MHVYKSVVEKFLPTPSKSHYVFNLRDFARVVFGVLLVPSTHLQEGDKLIRLWIHEVYRVFYDRLIDNNDRVMFFEMMKETTKQQFKKDMDGLLDHIVPTGQKLKDDHIRWFFCLFRTFCGHKTKMITATTQNKIDLTGNEWELEVENGKLLEARKNAGN